MNFSDNSAPSLSDDSIVVAASRQEMADAIKNNLSLRNEPIVALTHGALNSLSETPALLILDIENLENQAFITSLIQKIPTLVLAETFNEESFLTYHDLGVLDYLVHPVPATYFVAKVLDSLHKQQLNEQVIRYKHLLQQMGAVSERSDTLKMPQMLTRVEQSITENQNNPTQPQSLLLVSWQGMPTPCDKATESAVYKAIAQRLQEAGRTNDWIGEFLEEKFLVLLPNTPISGVNALASRLAGKLKEPITLPDKTSIRLQFGLGGAQYQVGQHYEAWIQQAFQRLTPIPQ